MTDTQLLPTRNGRPPLTERQAELLHFVKSFRAQHGKPPSVTQIAQALRQGQGVASSVVSLHVMRIRAKGYEVLLAHNNGVHQARICEACPARVEALQRTVRFLQSLGALGPGERLMRDQLVDDIAGAIGEVK